MMLVDLPLILALIGLAIYTVLAGADFGAGAWQLTAGRGRAGQAIRDYTYHAIAPVWEANHVWLIFVITVVWTAYPAAFAAIASTCSIPLSIAGVGIILRGAAYAMHSATRQGEGLAIDLLFSISSVLTPFSLGAIVGAIASGRVPPGNAAGDLVTSWLNPTSILIGILAVLVGAFLSAIYLSAVAMRLSEPTLLRAFRVRALLAGAVTGAVAVLGLFVLREDSPALFHGLTSGAGLVAVAVSILAGLATLVLVWQSRFPTARVSAALAVSCLIFGWAAGQSPDFLRGLTVTQAAAPRSSLIAITIASLAGAVLVAPSLGLLFTLTLRGQFEPSSGRLASLESRGATVASRHRVTYLSAAAACLVLAAGFLVLGDAAWQLTVGVAGLVGCGVVTFAQIAPGRPPTETTADKRGV
jgi:cytochrome d ubiquinol oxidase subunit II